MLHDFIEVDEALLEERKGGDSSFWEKDLVFVE